jgi:hypothetical protein
MKTPLAARDETRRLQGQLLSSGRWRAALEPTLSRRLKREKREKIK